MIWIAFIVVILIQAETHRRMSRLEKCVGGILHRDLASTGLTSDQASRVIR